MVLVLSFFVFFISFQFFLEASFQVLIDDLNQYHQLEVLFPANNVEVVSVKGERFVFDFNKNRLDGINEVEANYQDIMISSDYLEYAIDTSLLTLYSNVHVTKSEFDLMSNRVEAMFPYRVSAFEDVQINFESYVSMSNKAFYNLDENVIVLAGNAELKGEKDMFKGETIKFNFNDKKVITDGRSKVKISTDKL